MVAFEPWSPAVFKRSLAEEKPILLSISATWCHWCHEMDRQTYSSPAVIEFLKNHFLTIRVDTDQRPDINRRYNQGGWPSTVFLTGQGEIITGATFLPPADFLEIATQVRQIHRELNLRGRTSAILGGLEAVPTDVPSRLGFEARRATFRADVENFLTRFEEEIKSSFDAAYGGFGPAPKFPWPTVLEFCRLRYQQTRDPDLFRILHKSLEAYAEGRLFDHLEGGFFRYSTDRMFERVHSEKMLTDNLQLLVLFHEAGQLFGENFLGQVVQETLSFLKEWLFDGQFYFASVSAQEDYYCHLAREERLKSTKPSVDRTIFTDLNAQAALALWRLAREEEARRLIKEIFSRLRDEAGLFRHFMGDRSASPRFLSEQSQALRALVQICPEERRLAADLLRLILLNFYDEEKGGFFDRRREEEENGLLKLRLQTLEENLILVPILRDFGFAERAEKTLLSVFNLDQEISLSLAPLAVFFLETTAGRPSRPTS